MIAGFDSFLIMNDNSTDDTQCILDAYAKERIVFRVPTDLGSGPTGIAPYDQHTTFQACTEYLSQQVRRESVNAKELWMSTHDLDEFLWFDKTKAGSVKDMVRKLPRHGQVQSFAIPRHLFGSSGHDHYDPELVIRRFTHRYAPENCPNTDEAAAEHEQDHNANQRAPRRLLNHLHPKGYCDYKNKRQFDNYKSMSLVSALATDCYTINNSTTSRTKKTKVYCHSPHTHQLVPSGNSSTGGTSPATTLRDAREAAGGNDPRYLAPSDILDSLVLMHYMIRSKEEFFHHICDSRFSSKYYLCGGCNPETHFDFTETYSNLLQDTRMLSMVDDLKVFLKESQSITTHCNVEPPSTKPWEYYRECFQHQSDELNNK
jgi:Glycosyl transferase family 2